MRNLIALWCAWAHCLLFFICMPIVGMDDGTAPDFPASIHNLPNSRRNMMCMTLTEDTRVILSIKVEAFMHYRDRVASIVIQIKGDNVESEVTRLFFDI